MSEWRDAGLSTYERIEEYEFVSQDRLAHLSDCLDYLYKNYIDGAIDDSSRMYDGLDKDRKVQTLNITYSNFQFNDYHEGVVTESAISLQIVKDKKDAVRESRTMTIERNIAVERKSKQKTDAIFSDETSIAYKAFTEYFLVNKLVGGGYSAYVSRLEGHSTMTEVNYEPMSLYDLADFVSELDKIADLYASYKIERAIMEQ
jgi:hypothetical protein